MSNTINYLTLQEALSPKDETIYFVADTTGTPRLRFDMQLGYFVKILPLEADLDRLMRSNANWEVKEAIAMHPRVTPDILLRLSQHKNSAVKRAALMNPAFPKGAKSKLAKVA
jgi:hypothetical protein